MKIEVPPVPRGAHPHMDNFLDCVRSRQEPNLPARRSAIRRWRPSRMGVLAYRQHEVLFFDCRRQKVTNKPVTT